MMGHDCFGLSISRSAVSRNSDGSIFVAGRRDAVLWSMDISGNAEAKVVIQPTGSQWVALDDKISALTLQPAH